MSRSTPSEAVAEARGRPLSHAVLDLIWQRQEISRADVARLTGLSRSTVSEIASELLRTKLISEGGDGPSRGGRRPILLKFNDDAHVILGVDMGSTHISVVLTDLRGREIGWEHRDHPVRTDPQGTERLITDLCGSLLRRHEGGRKRLLGVGVAVPSPIDPMRPGKVSDVLLPDWSGHGIVEKLQFAHEVPVLVENDANLGALAEHWWGAGRGLDDFTYIKFGTGVGSGHILNGEIYRGTTGVAGEIGHVVVVPGGPTCSCGNRGCLETMVGTRALLARARALLPDFPESVLKGSELTIEAIETAALEGDELALAMVDEAGAYIATAASGVINLLNPSAVVLGGSLSRLGSMLLAPIRERARAQTLVNSMAAASIMVTQLGPHAIARGAATLVLDHALSDPTVFPSLALR